MMEFFITPKAGLLSMIAGFVCRVNSDCITCRTSLKQRKFSENIFKKHRQINGFLATHL